jgi:competence protein ComEC
MRRVSVVVIILLGVILGLCRFLPDENMHLVFCDVGQGDAILAWENSTQLLIDAGPDEKVLECLEKYVPWWDRRLEFVLATHPDVDHIGGLEPVFRQYNVGDLITNGDTRKTSVFRRFQTLVQTNKHRPDSLIIGKTGDKMSISPNLSIKILSPLVGSDSGMPPNEHNTETGLLDLRTNIEQKDEQYNHRSIALLLTLASTKTLMMGDLDELGELALMQEGLIENVNILKVAHHGSKSSTQPQFLSYSKPEISVLSLEENNPYGHPSDRVLSDLGVFGSKIFRTDQLGNIHFVISDDKIWLASD